MDPLSDVLEAVRLTGAVFFELHATQPWVAETPAVAEIVGGIFPGTKHLIPYHAVLSGECWAWPIHSPPVHLQAGDVVVFPHGDAHVVSSAPGMRGVPDHSLYRRPREEALPFRVRTGASGAESARIVCGYLGCDDGPFNPLLSALPATIAMHDRGDGALSALLAFALNESREPRIGSESVLGRLSELMFVEVLRRYVETIPPGNRNWLAALRDPIVGGAIAALHGEPEREWNLADLARTAGASRSVLSARFTALVGTSPMQYLAKWRMQLAARQLRAGIATVAQIAERTGYESEAAFSRAFKKIVGVSPGALRRHAQPSDS